jgi:glycosyltransferase involved in cell wall biosynthesis
MRSSAPFHIVLCAYRPELRYFKQQIRSIAAQTMEAWTCEVRLDEGTPSDGSEINAILGGDLRFKLTVNPRRLGPFHNFEAGVVAAPAAAKFIAYADQDDEWLPEKLATMLAAFEDPEVMLVHSDLEVIDADGKRLHDSCFRLERRVLNDLSLPQLILRNAVTGCTSAFRAQIKPHLVPFPRQGLEIGFHHDLWTALIAAQHGRIKTISKPLVRYRQHGKNVIGAEPAGRKNGTAPFDLRMRAWIINWSLREGLIQEVLVRPPPNNLPKTLRDRAEIRRWLRPHTFDFRLSRRAVRLWLRGFPAGDVAIQTALGRAIVHRPRIFAKLRIFRNRWRDRFRRVRLLLNAARRFGGSPAFRDQVYTALARDTATNPITPGKGEELAAPEDAISIRTYYSPLPLRLTAAEPRVVVVVPSGRLEDMYGGLATAFNFGAGLARRGIPVRFLSIDRTLDPSAIAALRAFLTDRCGFTSAPELIEIVSTIDAEAPAHRGDIFVATIWWSARRIFHSLEQGGFDNDEFYYLIQDYEPGFYPWSDDYAFAESTYRMPCRPIVNTKFLAEHLQRAVGLKVPESLIFAPEIDWTMFHPPSVEDIASRSRRRIFLYGRPGTPRNLFGIAVESLRRFVAEVCPSQDDLEVISGGEMHGPIGLGRGIVMRSAGKLSMGDYAQALRESDVGLSLMLSPHPSYPPFEMAASGMSVVTNDFSTKQMSFSENFIATVPAPEAIAEGLKEAWARAADGPARIRGARFDLAHLGRQLDLVVSDLAVEMKKKLRPAPANRVVAARAPRRCRRTGLVYSISHGATQEFRDESVCLFAHFDVNDRIDRHVLYYLNALKAEGFKIVLITSSKTLSAESLAAAREICAAVVQRENRGFDFAGWALAMEAFPTIADARELLITNDSIYGPMRSLDVVFKTMRDRPCDFWGLTESLEIMRHLQSYFILFNRAAIKASAFRTFWSSVRALSNKSDIINKYEVQLTPALNDAGLVADAFIPSKSQREICNPTLAPWRSLLQDGFPFVKVQLLRDNPLDNDISNWDRSIGALDYDVRMIVDHLARVRPDAKGLSALSPRPRINGRSVRKR